ncbi:MAG: hydrolase [Pseudomonadota bacterium]
MFSVNKTVMLLIDVQGRLAQLMNEKEKLFKSLQIMIQAMKILEVPIVWMEQIPDKLGRTSVDILQFLSDQSPIEKSSFSCCEEPVFMEKFKKIGRNQVLLTGIETHICVFQTGTDLIQKGYDVQVVADCVSSRTKENKNIGIQRLCQSGAQITSLEMILFELLKVAEGDKFRQIVKLLK